MRNRQKNIDFKGVKNYNEEEDRGDVIMAKMGRPKLDDPRINKVSVRFSNEEKQVLESYAESHGLSKAQVLKVGFDLLLKLDKEQK